MNFVDMVDITPDPSLISKLGATGYRTYEAIAELIDNSIDARLLDKKLRIDIKLDFKEQTITVQDDGSGMDKETLRNAMTLAYTEKKKRNNKLGFYGLGLKTAASSLGESFYIKTKTQSSKHKLICFYKESEWLKGTTDMWKQFPIHQEPESSQKHYTIIRIEDIRNNLYRNITNRFKEAFSFRYSPLLKAKQVDIWVNNLKCQPQDIEIVEKSRRDFNLTLPNGNIIRGWGALRKIRKGTEYGFNLYKNNRLIIEWDKSLLGREAHSAISTIIGDLHLDHVPALYNKTDFLRESEEFKEVKKAFPEYPVFKELKGDAREPIYSKEMSTSLKGKINDITTNFIRNLNQIENYDYKSLEKFEKGKDHKLFTFKLDTHNVKKKVDVYLVYLQNLNPVEINDTNTIDILINKNSPLYYFNHNKARYISNQIVDTLSYIIAKKNNLSLEEFLEIHNKLALINAKESRDRIIKKSISGISKKDRNESTLIDNLKDMNHFLKKEFTNNSFYFTATSTLTSRLTHIPRTNYYFIYCEKGMGEKIQSVIKEKYKRVYSVILNPDKFDSKNFDQILKESEKTNIIILREKGRDSVYKKDGSVASIEVSIVDLVFEITNENLHIPLSDVDEIILELLPQIKKTKLLRYAHQRGLKDFFSEKMGEFV